MEGNSRVLLTGQDQERAQIFLWTTRSPLLSCPQAVSAPAPKPDSCRSYDEVTAAALVRQERSLSQGLGWPERSPAQAPLRTVHESFPAYGSIEFTDQRGGRLTPAVGNALAPDKVNLIRYADDFTVTAEDRETLELLASCNLEATDCQQAPRQRQQSAGRHPRRCAGDPWSRIVATQAGRRPSRFSPAINSSWETVGSSRRSAIAARSSKSSSNRS